MKKKTTRYQQVSILILAKNIFSRSGGGETVYRAIIKNNPNYNFYYLADDLKNENNPKNANPFQNNTRAFLRKKNEISGESKKIDEILNLLTPFSGMEFDIIDTPDFLPLGKDIRISLKLLNIKYKQITVALHGILSKYNQIGWEEKGESKKLSEKSSLMFKYEMAQIRTADFIYGISEPYLESFPHNNKFFIDPIRLLFNNSQSTKKLYLKPRAHYLNKREYLSIVYIGRLDRQKGPDIVLDIASKIGNAINYELFFFSTNDESKNQGIKNLAAISKNRCLKFNIYFGKKTKYIFNYLKNKKALILIPSRQDSLNIVSLEAINFGIPFLIRDECGATSYLWNLFGKNFSPFHSSSIEDFLKKILEIESNYYFYKKVIFKLNHLFYLKASFSHQINPYHSFCINHSNLIESGKKIYLKITELLNYSKFYFYRDYFSLLITLKMITLKFKKFIRNDCNRIRKNNFFSLSYYSDITIVIKFEELNDNFYKFLTRLIDIVNQSKYKISFIFLYSGPDDKINIPFLISRNIHFSILLLKRDKSPLKTFLYKLQANSTKYVSILELDSFPHYYSFDFLYEFLEKNDKIYWVEGKNIYSSVTSGGWLIEDQMLNKRHTQKIPFNMLRKEIFYQKEICNLNIFNFLSFRSRFLKKDSFLKLNKIFCQFYIYSEGL
jgi:hypothetical protein